ncbi:MAG TPA: hypothetical protein VM408_06220, partial [Methylomirabilota bacterium]|nr:hypothetical protein [Methylomirabilota bacterium]
MAVKEHGSGSAKRLGAGPEDVTGKASDANTQPALPAARPSDALTVPLVVPNSLWQAADPEAYDGGRPT